MKTVKEILTENRDSVISSIKFTFRIWKNEDVKVKMIEFFAYATEFANVEILSASKRVKTDLKDLICKMEANQKREKNIEIYGTATPKLSEIIGRAHEDESFNHLTKSWTNNSFEVGVNRY